MVKLNRIGVIKVASFLGIFGVFIGLILDLITIISKYTGSLFSNFDVAMDGGLGWISLILFPLEVGVLSFLIGLIFIPLMNLVLRIVKGIDLDMVE